MAGSWPEHGLRRKVSGEDGVITEGSVRLFVEREEGEDLPAENRDAAKEKMVDGWYNYYKMRELEDVLDENGISVVDSGSRDGEDWTDVRFESDAGEDMLFAVWHDGTPEKFADGFWEAVCDFDPEEHALEMARAGEGGLSGAPGLRVLMRDADETKNFLSYVGSQLFKSMRGEETVPYGMQEIPANEKKFAVDLSEGRERSVDNLFEAMAGVVAAWCNQEDSPLWSDGEDILSIHEDDTDSIAYLFDLLRGKMSSITGYYETRAENPVRRSRAG